MPTSRGDRSALAGLPPCRAEVAELREVAALLANNDTEAPDGVWDRIAEAIDEEPPPMRLDVGRRRSRELAPLILSAAAVIAILLLGWQVLDLRSQNDRIQKQVAAADANRATVNEANLALLEPNSQVVRLTGTGDQRALAVLTDQGTGYLFAGDLPAARKRCLRGMGSRQPGHADGPRLDGETGGRQVRCRRRCRQAPHHGRAVRRRPADERAHHARQCDLEETAHVPHQSLVADARFVTLSATYGAGGSVVGPLLARRLALPFGIRLLPASDAPVAPSGEGVSEEEREEGPRRSFFARLANLNVGLNFPAPRES